MNVKILESSRVICSNRESLHNYFAWPSVTRLKDGRLAMVSSGFRIEHVDPFGKGIMCISEDEGKTWSKPLPVIDTVLDDRDCGICTFGDSGVVITSFTLSNAFQRERIIKKGTNQFTEYKHAFIALAEQSGLEEKYVGYTYVVSNDNGKTFSEVKKSLVTSPHGPLELPDGNLLFVGKTSGGKIESYTMPVDGGSMKMRGSIKMPSGSKPSEPHAVLLENGKIIVHVRVEGDGRFTIYQSESDDYGKTFTEPHQILEDKGGAPAHLLQLSNGILISTYGYRQQPYGVKVMLSRDNGETWKTDIVLADGFPSSDLGYPCSVELKDGSILTVFYAHETAEQPAEIMQVKWKIE